MQRESQKDRTILCKYEPTEPGDYRIEVKWSGEHVPGSPMMVMIFDTQEELSRFLQVIFVFLKQKETIRLLQNVTSLLLASLANPSALLGNGKEKKTQAVVEICFIMNLTT